MAYRSLPITAIPININNRTDGVYDGRFYDEPLYAENQASAKTPPHSGWLRRLKETLVSKLWSNFRWGNWRLELLGWAIGTISLLAIILILALFNGKPVSSWHSTLQISTIISILSQAAQVSLLLPLSGGISQLKWMWFQGERDAMDMELYDLASRGPWGSLLLLFRFRRLQMVTLGAITTILMLSLSPFAQQAVRVDDMRLARSANVSMSTKLEISPFRAAAGQDEIRNPGRIVKFQSVPPRWRVAINQGLFDDNASYSEIAENCPTESCSWPVYSSLGICATRTEVEGGVLKDCPSSREGDRENCTYSTAALQEQPPWASPNMTNGRNFFIGSPNNPNKTYEDPSKLAEFIVIFPTKLLKHSEPVLFTTDDYAAYQVTLNLCVMHFESRSSNGVTDTRLSSTATTLDWARCTNETTGVDTLTARIPGDVSSSAFTVPVSVVASFKSYLTNIVFSGTANLFRPSDNLPSSFTSDAARALGAALLSSHGRPFAESLQSRMDIFSRSMTNALQRHATSSLSLQGTAFAPRPHVAVNFWWLFVPAALYISATAFLVATAAAAASATNRTQAPLWKANQLAVLQCMDLEGISGTVEGAEALAHRSTVQLQRNPRNDRWRLAMTIG